MPPPNDRTGPGGGPAHQETMRLQALDSASILPQPTALELAQRGLWVFPVDHPELPQCVGVGDTHITPCYDRGKHPANAWNSGATQAPANIAHLFSGTPRNVGIHCGKSGLLVVDEDAPGEFQRFADERGHAIPETYTVQTAKGKHYYFRDTENGRLGLREGAFTDYDINIRSGVGYVVGPGSVHASGVVYTENGVRDYADVPAWVVEAIDGPKRSNGEHRTDGPFETFELPDVIKYQKRDTTLFQFASSMRAQSINYATAKTLMQWAHGKCEQPPGKPFLLESAYAKLDQAYKYPPGRSEGYGQTSATGQGTPDRTRKVLLTPASEIKVRRVWWLWNARLAIGTLALLAGREGLGKSILAYTIAAMITRGELPGEHFGTPRAVLIAATEDSWAQTIAPRLIAAGADLALVFKIEILDVDVPRQLDLPVDLERVKDAVEQTSAVLLILDPLLSRLSDKLDTHKDAEVRTALEPLVATAEKMDFSVLGLIHHNKSGTSDPLQAVMASKAFTAVARSVHTVMTDPDDETERRRLYGTPKNNLGRDDLPVLGFTISTHEIPTDEGPAETGQLQWGKDAEISIFEAMRRSTEDRDKRDAGKDAAEWLEDYLQSRGGKAESQACKKAAREAKVTEWQLRRARDLLKVETERAHDFQDPKTFWSLPGRDGREAHGREARGETLTTNTTNTKGNGAHGRVGRVGREDSPGEPSQTGTLGEFFDPDNYMARVLARAEKTKRRGM